jgi:hypothetical protein
LRRAIALALLSAVGTVPAHAQRLSVDAGILIGNFPSEPVYELHGDSPPFWKSRASFTISWTTDVAKPAVITEVERSLVDVKAIGIGLGGGLLWLDDNHYRPYPLIISTTFVPLPIPRTGVVAIAATQPFQQFDWSLVVSLSVGLYSGR